MVLHVCLLVVETIIIEEVQEVTMVVVVGGEVTREVGVGEVVVIMVTMEVIMVGHAMGTIEHY